MTKITAVTVLFVLSASTALAQQQMVAFDRDHPLRFDHLCSELGHGYGAYRVVICGQTLVGYTLADEALASVRL